MPEIVQHVTEADLEDGDVHLAINRPARSNALDLVALDQLLDGLRRAEEGGARVLVITGVGRHFSAGADLTEIRGTGVDEVWFDRMDALTWSLTASPVLSIAAIEGGCLGAGLELALSCDVRVAAPGAFFGLPSVSMGLLYAPETLGWLAALVGEARSQRLALLGDRLSAREAYDCGLVVRVDEDPLVAADEVRSRIRARPEAARDTVRCLRAATPRVPDQPWRRLHRESLTRPERLAAVTEARAKAIREDA